MTTCNWSQSEPHLFKINTLSFTLLGWEGDREYQVLLAFWQLVAMWLKDQAHNLRFASLNLIPGRMTVCWARFNAPREHRSSPCGGSSPLLLCPVVTSGVCRNKYTEKFPCGDYQRTEKTTGKVSKTFKPLLKKTTLHPVELQTYD